MANLDPSPAANPASKERKRRRRRRRRHPTAAPAGTPKLEAPASGNHEESIMPAKGDPSQEAGCILVALEDHSGVDLVQNTTEQKGNLKQAIKGNNHARNKVIQVSGEDGVGNSSHIREKSVQENDGTGSMIFNKSDVSCPSNEDSTPGNAEVNKDPKNKIDPCCPEMKNTNLAENKYRRRKKMRQKNNHCNCSNLQNLEETNKSKSHSSPNGNSLLENSKEIKTPESNLSPNCSSLQNLGESKKLKKKASPNCSSSQENLEANKKPRKRRRGKKNNHPNKSTSPASVLPVGADKAGLLMMVAENNVPGRKHNGSRQKQNQNEVTLTNSSVGVESTVEKKDGLVPSGLLEEEEADHGTKSLKVTSSNLSFTLVQGVEFDTNVKANCLHSTIEEKNFQIALAEGITDRLDVASRTCISERNQKMGFVECTGNSSFAQAHEEKLKNVFSPRGSLIRFRRKKLLILDLNGLLADINDDYHNAHMASAKVRGKLVFRRPYCEDFLNFCLQNFELGIWSSRKRENVDSVVNILMRDIQPYLLFCWDLSKCTVTGRKTLENRHKPLVLKELKKLWNKEEHDLPWEQGNYSPSNTLLVDDSPYKALCNPPHTAIFPYPYSYHNLKDDSLGPGGDLRVYLESLVLTDDVACYVREHPFGQPSITESDPHWDFYAQIAVQVQNSLA